MPRFVAAAVGLLVLGASAAPLSAAPVLERLRGAVETVTPDTLTILSNDGKTISIALDGDTKVASVTKSSLDAIKDGVFIGTATKGENPPVALEVVVFPEAMRGTGEGHYDWDVIADTTAGGKPVSSAMTNGTIKAVSRPMVKSAMTNGTVKSGGTASGEKKLTVAYGDKTIDITVPPSAPVVTVAPASTAVLKPGTKVFVVVASDAGKMSGKRILAGADGITPPM